MDYMKYVEQKQNIQNIFIAFIEKEYEASDIFNNLINEIKKQKILEDTNDLREFLHFLSNFTNNYHRKQGFITKIEQVLNYLKKDIGQSFTNSRIYDIFKDNKLIIFILFRNNILIIDETILDDIISEPNLKFFLYPEIKAYTCNDYLKKQLKRELLKYDPDVFTNFEEKRQKGENETYLAQLIQEDLIKEFVIFYNKAMLTPFSMIKQSIFETNDFLNKPTSLIEYAAFYGSFKVFLYLMSSIQIYKIGESLYLHAIHSLNSHLIHAIENKMNKLSTKEYLNFFQEAVKCHHNNIAFYILKNFIDEKSTPINCSVFFQANNYTFFPNNIENESLICDFCQYDYYKLVEYSISIKKQSINQKKNILLKCFCFTYIIHI